MESPFLQAHGILRYIGLFLSGVCHQLPEHSLILAGRQIPLCARCSGTYLGALLGLCNLWARGRARASRLAPGRVLAVLAAFGALWAVDGLNSYYQFLTSSVALYTPSNLFRLATGMGTGLALSLVIAPMFNFTFWREPDPRRVINGLGELAALVLQVAGVVLLLQTRACFLFYPLLAADTLSVLLVLAVVNSLIVVILLHQENTAERWRQALLPLLLGLLLTLVEVGGIAFLRYWLSPWLVPPTTG
jgi:uncharacterized membrane protein